jgi:3-deoxy-D-manno-octulosonic-acid transferase
MVAVLPRLIYSTLLLLLAPAAWIGLWWRARGDFSAWQPWAAERFGRYPQPWDGATPIWVHAVSVGEVRAAKPLIQALALQGHAIILTHLTPTGRAEGQRLLVEEIRRGQVWQQWMPYDLPGSMRRFYRQFKPRLVILIEREVWPNLVHVGSQSFTPVVLASARLSERSLKRSRWMDRLFGGLLHDTYRALTLVLAQSDDDARRLFDAGVMNARVCGNLKFDMQLPHVAVEAGRHWRQKLSRAVVAIASTREGEDKPLIDLIKSRLDRNISDPGPLYLLIPRHPQRFDEAARLLDAAGCRYARWSTLRDDPNSQDHLKDLDVVLGDTMGEMPFFYAASDVALVGGSFEPHGGQNFIEACAVGTPVVVGPHTRNFEQAVTSALAAGAIVQATDANAAFEQLDAWLTVPEQAATIGRAGKSWVANHIGATQRMVQAINELQEQD